MTASTHAGVIRRLFLAGAAALALAACDGGGEDGGQGGGDARTLRFSILPTENSANLQQLWAPFLADMEKQTGLNIEPQYVSNYTALITAMASDQIDVGWFSNASGLQAVRRAGGEVFARSSDPSGEDGYQSVLIVNTRSPLTLETVLRCDKSLSFGLGDAASTSGTLAPMTYLFAPRNIDPEACFKNVRSANHEANLLGVANNVLDVATNNTTNIKRLARSAPQTAARVKVIWSSPMIPEDPIVWRKELDPALKEKVRQFFITYGAGQGPEAERQRKILADLDFGVFRAADDSHLLPVREMEATERLIQARNSRNAAAVEQAQVELENIRAERAELEARTGRTPENPTAPVPAR